MEDLVNCFHCKEQVRVNVNERFVQKTPTEYTQRLSSVTCQSCGGVLGFIDSALADEVIILKNRVAELEKTSK